MSWFLVGVLLQSFFYLQVVVGDYSQYGYQQGSSRYSQPSQSSRNSRNSQAYNDNGELFCPSFIYYADKLQNDRPNVDNPCVDDTSCNNQYEKCCATTVVDKYSGENLGSYSQCTTAQPKTAYGYCPSVPIMRNPICYGTQCTPDTGCPGTDMCCADACGGTSCMAPSYYPVTKDGDCPSQIGYNPDSVFCNGDFNCPDDEKCCQGSCAFPNADITNSYNQNYN